MSNSNNSQIMKQTIYLIAVCLMFPAFALAAGAGEPDAAGLQAIQGAAGR